MQLTIDSTLMDFYLSQGNQLLIIEGKQSRGNINSEYTSENKSLLKYYKESPIVKISLINIFDSVTLFEQSLHKLYNKATIKNGEKEFLITSETINLGDHPSGGLAFNGFIQDEIKVSYKKNANKIKAEIVLNVVKTDDFSI